MRPKRLILILLCLVLVLPAQAISRPALSPTRTGWASASGRRPRRSFQPRNWS